MKARDSIIMIGAPDSGKTNYLGRLWRAVAGENASLRATQQPDDVRYVLDALTHLLQGTFAPRTDTNVDVDGRDCSIQVAWEREGATRHAELLVPDVSGELWADAVQTNELPETWVASVRQSIGALLFVRIDSDLHIPSLDWVTARERLEVGGEDAESQIPTDVQLCEFLRFLELLLGKDAGVGKPRVGVLVAAWDILDEHRSQQGPKAYLRHEFPLFSNRLADISTVEVEVFGVSVVGGDFRDEAFRDRFLAGQVDEFGFVVTEPSPVPPCADVTIPVRWVLDGKASR